MGTVVVFERDWETKEENETFVFLHLFNNYFQVPTRCRKPGRQLSERDTKFSPLGTSAFVGETIKSANCVATGG